MANGTLAASQIEMLTQSGTGIVTIVPPTTNTNRTLTLPDSTGTLLNTNGGTITGNLTVSGIATLANNAVLGVPSSGTLTNLTGLPLTTGVTGTLPVANGGTGITSFGSGVATFLGTPSSANLIAAITDETGTGALVFANTPTLVTPLLGTPTSGVATNLTGLPLTTGVTGVLPTANGGTNLSSFTANGVVYASSSSALATGSALVFDGTSLSTTGQILLNNNNYIGFKNTTGTYAASIFNDTSNFLNLYNSGNTGTIFYVNAAEQVRLTSTGLGIGTSSPLSKVDARAASAIIGNYQTIQAFSTDTSAAINLGGGIGLGGFYNSTQIAVFGNIVGRKENATDGNYAGYLAFGTNAQATGVVERMRITSDGKLGVGTDAPDAPLTLKGGSNIALKIISDSGSGTTATLYGGANAGVRYGALTLNRSDTSAITTYISGDPTDGSYIAGNLGIGTTSPSARLSVNLDNTTAYANTAPNSTNCTAAFTNTSGHTAGGTFVGYQLNISGNSQNRIGYIGGITDSTSNQALSLVFGTNTAAGDRSEKMRLDSSGNLGIGTTAPAYRVTSSVSSTSTSITSFTNESIVFTGVNTGTATANQLVPILFRYADGTYNGNGIITALRESATGRQQSFVFAPSNASGDPTEKMRLNSSGNLGIGTTNPSFAVEIQGSVGTNGDAVRNLALIDTQTSGTGVGGGIAFGGYYDGTTSYVNDFASIQGFKENGTAGNYAGALRFTTRINGGTPTERIRLDSNGNLLVGTTTAFTKVSIAASNAATSIGAQYNPGILNIQNTSATNGNLSLIGFQDASAFINLAAIGAINTTHSASPNTVVGELGFYTKASGVSYVAERMRLNSSGYVGIGITEPVSSLHIKMTGTAFTVPTNNAIGGGNAGRVHFIGSEPGLMLSSDMNIANAAATGTGTISLGLQIGYYGANDVRSQVYWAGTPLTFTYGSNPTASPTERMRIAANGNVGIGTTNPGEMLEVAGKVLITDGGNYTVPSLKLGTTNNGLSYPTTNVLGFITASTARMTIDATGNVGIGTTSPSSYSGAAGQLIVFGGVSTTFTNNPSNITLVNNGTIAAGLGTGILFSSNYNDSSTTTYAIISGIRENATSGNAAGALVFGTRDSGGSVTTERGRFDSSGNLLVGRTTTSNTTVGASLHASGLIASCQSASTNGNSSYDLYSTGAAGYRFYVGMGGTIFATNTAITSLSDQRLKENIRDLDDGLEKLLALKPRRFDWKEGKGPNTKNVCGFIAQEFETVFPEMIDTWKDTPPEGEEPYKAVNANLIPTLVKAIQEQQALITQLTARITALETP